MGNIDQRGLSVSGKRCVLHILRNGKPSEVLEQMNDIQAWISEGYSATTGFKRENIREGETSYSVLFHLWFKDAKDLNQGGACRIVIH